MLNQSRAQYIAAIAEFRSISKAANHLYISQPALTKYVNKLEDELGVQLFDRSVSPIRLTYAGERYIAEAKKMQEINNRLYKELEEIAQMKRGRLTIGIASSRGLLWLPHILPPFHKKYPEFEIKVVEGSSGFFESEILKGAIDIGFFALPILSPDIEYEVLAQERMILSVPQGHPILEGEDTGGNSPLNLLYIPPERLNGQHFLTLFPGQGQHRTTHLIFERHGIKPGSVMELNNGDTAFLLSAQGMGLCFYSESVYNLRIPNEPVYCTVENPPYTRQLVAAYKKDVTLSTAARKFINMTRDTVSTLNQRMLEQYYGK